MGTPIHRWVRIDNFKPMKGTRVIAFTPVVGTLRFRIVDDDLLSTLSEATHWAYLQSPADHEIEPSSV
jgi:hypothetical protein